MASRTDLARGVGPAVIAASFLAVLAWTWGTWPDPSVDFGRELYIAWQLAAGKVLYGDIAYYNGPLSPYLNALWFRVFGVSLRTLALCNAAIALVLAFLLYRLLAQASSRLAATVAVLVFVAVFACAQLIRIANYNFVCPYSHEVTHGIALSVVALACLARYRTRREVGAIAGAGFALGLAFLTKQETFLAGAVGVVTGLALLLSSEPRDGSRGRLLLVFVATCAVPPLVALALLSRALPAGRAVEGILGAWPSVLRGDVASTFFYRAGLGTLDVPESVASMARWSAAWAAAFGPIAALAMLGRRAGARAPRMAAALALPVALLVGSRLRPMLLADAGRALPVLLGGLALALAVGFVRHRAEPAVRSQLALRLSLVAFGAAMLGKMLLNARVYHYGFGLAMPGTLVVVLALVDWIPRAIDRRGGDGAVFRAAALACIVVFALAEVEITSFWLGRKTTVVGRGPDAFLADERGAVVARALDEIARRVPPEATLTAMPEGVMLSFLSRRRDPNPYLNFMPPMLALFGEDAMLAAFRAEPPDYIAVVHKDTTEYGVGPFGRGYARRLYRWVRRNYRPLTLVGAPPSRDDRFGIVLLGRRG